MRTTTVAIALALAGCGQERAAEETASAPAATASAEGEERVFCARAGAELVRTCTLEQLRSDEGLALTVRHPDGAFRRLLVTTDGRGVVAADGAEPARVRIVGVDEIEVGVADERYRLPATVQGRSPAS